MSKTDEEIECLIKDYAKAIVIILSSYHSQKEGIELDDLVQEVYIRIWKTYKSDGHDIGAFYSYLRKIINSVFVNEIKKRIKDKKIIATVGPVTLPYDLPKENQNDPNDELRSLLWGTLAKMNSPQRNTLKLRLAGLSLEDIARLNRWSEAKTRNIYYRGLNTMKQLVRKKGFEYED